MATIRQEKTAKNILNSTTRKEAMEKAEFSPSYSTSGQILKTKGWQELMEKYLPDKDLAKVHKQGLKATKLFSSHTEPDKEVPDYAVRHKYLETGYRVKGKIKEPEESEKPKELHLHFHEEKILQLVQKVEKEIKEELEK